MKTEVVMKRVIFDQEISQKSKSEFFSATDLVRAGNIWRLSNGLAPFDMRQWFQQKNTKAVILSLEERFGKVKISGRGRGNHTWVHPFLFIDIALTINPEFKIEVYKWLYDKLLQYRNDSGDSYKKMTGALYLKVTNKSEFKNTIVDVALKIQKVCHVNNWQEATEKQLNLRDKIHEYIFMLSDIIRDTDLLIITAIKKARLELKEKNY